MQRSYSATVAASSAATVASFPLDDERRKDRSTHLSVIVPVWNGAARLAENLRALDAALTEYPFESELLIVDDYSDAQTARVIERFAPDREVLVLRNDCNRGKGYSVARGMLAAMGSYRVFTDADLAYPACEIAKLVDALACGNDVVIGSRMLPESRSIVCPRTLPHVFTRHLMSRGFNAVVQRFLVAGVLDTQAGLKGFTQWAAELIFPRLTVARFGFDLECLFIARQHGLRIAQIPVTVRNDGEESTVRVALDGARMLRDVAKVRLNGWRGRYG